MELTPGEANSPSLNSLGVGPHEFSPFHNSKHIDIIILV